MTTESSERSAPRGVASGMPPGRRMSTLVVFYSRTGTTRRVAETLARALAADLEEIREKRDRLGVRGYLRSGFDAGLQRWVPIEPLGRDPGRYDLVVVGTPVWNMSLSAPVRTFLANNARRPPELAFFLTEGGTGDRRVFRQMEEVAGKRPVATLVAKQRHVESGRAEPEIDAFVARLRGKVTGAMRGEARLS